jgi:hypothetical protein
MAETCTLTAVGDYKDYSFDRLADETMKIPLTVIEDCVSTPSIRSDPVRLSRRATVKRYSVKDRKPKTERHGSTAKSTRDPAKTSGHTSGIQPTTDAPPLLRHFSFDQSPKELSFDLAS